MVKGHGWAQSQKAHSVSDWHLSCASYGMTFDHSIMKLHADLGIYAHYRTRVITVLWLGYGQAVFFLGVKSSQALFFLHRAKSSFLYAKSATNKNLTIAILWYLQVIQSTH